MSSCGVTSSASHTGRRPTPLPPFLAVPHLKTHDELKSTYIFRQRWRNHPGNTLFFCIKQLDFWCLVVSRPADSGYFEYQTIEFGTIKDIWFDTQMA